MLFLSQLLGRPVRDAGGETFAALSDLVGRRQRDHRLETAGLVARVGSRRFYVPWSHVAAVTPEEVALSSYQVNLQQFERRPGEALLAGDILDRRLIDVRHRKVIRANDILLEEAEGSLRLSAFDVGFPALLRRLAPRWCSSLFSGTSLVAWEAVELLPSEAAPELRHSFPLLSQLHPVEVAHIVDELPHRQGADIVESLEDEEAAEVLSELDEDHQARVLMNLDEERAADILEEMEPDDAADLLSRLSPGEADELLQRMDREEAQDVQALMEYREGTAGGLMTSHFVAVPQSYRCSEALGLLKGMEDRPETVTHLLVVEESGSERLVGMVALLDVVISPPEATLEDVMMRDVPTALPETSTSEVARRMAQYNLAVLPVVDAEGLALGIVAVDDVVEEMLPERWRRRLPRLFG